MKKKKFPLIQGINKVKEEIEKISNKEKVVIVGVAGGSGSGKGYVVKSISKRVKGKVVMMDDYYVGIGNMKDDNFDKPSAIDLNLLKKHLNFLKKKRSIEKPVYNFDIHKRIGSEKFSPQKVIIVEGLFILSEIFKKEVNLKLFIEAPEEVRLKRRIARDIRERARTKKDVICQWRETVEPMYKKYVFPQRKLADYIIENY